MFGVALARNTGCKRRSKLFPMKSTKQAALPLHALTT